MSAANPGVAVALRGLEDARTDALLADTRRDHYAVTARTYGATFPQIGRALGLTASGARDLVHRARNEATS